MDKNVTNIFAIQDINYEFILYRIARFVYYLLRNDCKQCCETSTMK